MEIDPEVAELLDDLPPVALPDALRDVGWGTMRMESVGITRSPSTTFQPTYDNHCAQCGRPLTSRGFWEDHAGSRLCENVFLDEQVSDYHLVEREIPFWTATVLRPDPPPIVSATCGAERATGACSHVCEHPGGHFGFHECKTCHHLWR